MNSRPSFLDPLAALVGLIVAVVAFFLIPGAAAAVLAALGIGILAYGATLGARILARARTATARPAVGAGSDAAGVPRVRRGSEVEAWQQRGHRAVEGMQQLVAHCEQPIIAGQLENVAFEARLSLPVLDDLAMQSAVVEASLLRGRPSALTAPSGQLDAGVEAQWDGDRHSAADGVEEQRAIQDRLQQTRAGLLTRMEALVRGLESLSAQMGETAASSAASVTSSPVGTPEHFRDLTEQLTGLQAGIEESRQYSAHITGTQPE